MVQLTFDTFINAFKFKALNSKAGVRRISLGLDIFLKKCYEKVTTDLNFYSLLHFGLNGFPDSVCRMMKIGITVAFLAGTIMKTIQEEEEEEEMFVLKDFCCRYLEENLKE